MTIHECGRCEGCGHVTGSYGWEIPWTKWSVDGSATKGFMRPSPCPDCGGTGALIVLPEAASKLRLASRRGLPRNGYAEHVAAVLQSQKTPHQAS